MIKIDKTEASVASVLGKFMEAVSLESSIQDLLRSDRLPQFVRTVAIGLVAGTLADNWAKESPGVIFSPDYQELTRVSRLAEGLAQMTLANQEGPRVMEAQIEFFGTEGNSIPAEEVAEDGEHVGEADAEREGGSSGSGEDNAGQAAV